MPKKKVVKRDYPFADSHLIQLCNMIISFLLRDILGLAVFGVTNLSVTAFTNEVNDFEELPTDVELKGTQRVKTEAKEAKRESILGMARALLARVVTVFPKGSAIYESFGLTGMNAMTDSDLLLSVRRAARVGTANLAALTNAGLTALVITDILNECQAFEDAIKEQKDAIADRDIATEARIEMGNALYKKLMDHCEFGQQLWAETSEAKYNDYVIYNSSGGLVNPIEMTIVAGETEMIINKPFAGTDSFEITITGVVKLDFGLCADAVTPVSGGVSLNPGETRTVTAAELGDFSVNQFLNCTNSNVSDGSFKVKIL